MLLPIKGPLSLRHTLECGQAFRWRERGGWYLGAVGGRALKVRTADGALEVRSSPPADVAFVRSYFRLDDNLEAIYSSIAIDGHIRRAVRRYRGLRLLRQEPWECLVSYLVSQASNIPRISKSIERLATRYGAPLELDGLRVHSFPSAEALRRAGPVSLKRLGLGFRARYVAGAARAVASGELDLEGLRALPTTRARAELMALPGVGAKVADCVLLFSLDRLEVFPVDRWVRRAVELLFFNGETLSEKRVREWGMRRYGRYAGYAQQYLFHYIRHIRSTSGTTGLSRASRAQRP